MTNMSWFHPSKLVTTSSLKGSLLSIINELGINPTIASGTCTPSTF
jgi:hypothetical protein